ncbi:hypothetical protein TNCV_4484061 [Trichonephila clavipes]|nr:hypothetical protein TNCV_4484061 [Trichonephila clavipes]
MSEHMMIDGARSLGTSVIKKTAFVNCQKAQVTNVYREWTPKQGIGWLKERDSNTQSQSADLNLNKNLLDEIKRGTWPLDPVHC